MAVEKDGRPALPETVGSKNRIISRQGAGSQRVIDPELWQQWFKTCLGGTLTTTGEKGAEVYQLSLKLPEKPLEFTASSVDFAFDDAKAIKFGSPKGGDILVLGLQPPAGLDMKLSELLDFVGLSYLSFVVTLLGAIPLTLDDAKGARNAVWFDPEHLNKTDIRLQFALKPDGIPDLFKRLLGDSFKITSAHVIAKKTLTLAGQPGEVQFSTDADAALTMDCELENSIRFSASVTFRPGSLELNLTPTSEVFGNVLDWLGSLVQFDDLGKSLKELLNKLNVEDPEICRITLVVAGSGSTPVPVFLSVDLSAKIYGALFLLTCTWKKGGGGLGLTAALWAESPIPVDDVQKVLPQWEQYLMFDPFPDEKPKPLGLTEITTSSPELPAELKQNINHLILYVDPTGVSLEGYLAPQKPEEGKITLDTIAFNGNYLWKSPSNFTLSFTVRALLKDPTGLAIAEMTGQVQHNSQVWSLEASIKNLSLSTLSCFMDDTSHEELKALLGDLTIESLTMEYQFNPRSFNANGKLRLGELTLKLNLIYNEEKWTFSAELDVTATNKSTLGGILDSLVGSSVDVPPFVRDIQIVPDKKMVTVNCEKTKTGLFFLVAVNLSLVGFTFIQYRKADTKISKRLFKVSIETLPTVTVMDIQFPQPFGEMFYMWVQAGLTEDDVAQINIELVAANQETLLFKKTTKPSEKRQTTVVIPDGSHFVLVAEDKLDVLLDYVFQKSTKPTTPKAASLAGDVKITALETEPEDTGTASSPDSSMVALKKSIGPILISNIGLQYKGGVLRVLLDATFLLGPISFSLLGFSLDLTLKDLYHLPTPDVKLGGLAVGFDRPPVLVSGLYKYIERQDGKYYEGGIIISFKPYLFEAVGFYGKSSGNHSFKSVFIFGRLNGPLVTLGFADISGISGGFGYNIDLQFPTASNVQDFPFFGQDAVQSTPLGTLEKFINPDTQTGKAWLAPRLDSFWVAAGLKVTAFQALDIDAVVVVEWNPSIRLGIFATASANFPKQANAEVRFAHVELGISATVDFGAGVMKFEGQLFPSSFVLHPSCHLTGGFALYHWFHGTEAGLAKHEGDWVFTIGGYHRSFKRPAHYPNPPRLAISWSVDSSISITGQAYFAITPKLCMGGGQLHASLSLGPLEAYFDAYADFLINYKPFYFTADMGVTVGVRFNLDMWIVSIHIGVEISAQLHLAGPPIAGILHVNFWVMGFDINFGRRPAAPLAPNLEEFYQVVLQSGPPSKDDNIPKEAHAIACQTGLLVDDLPKIPADQPWNVRGGSFTFQVSCRFPINTAEINRGKDQSTLVKNSNAIYAKPMNLPDQISSTMDITIHGTEELWRMNPVIRNVPSALWGKKNSEDKILDGNTDITSSHMMAVIIKSPLPVLSPDKLDVPTAMVRSVLSGVTFPDNKTPEGAWRLSNPQDPKEAWNEVQRAWREAKGQEETLSVWSKAFSWKGKLKGSAPQKLLRQFGDLYLAVPMLGSYQ